jgi:hypothetical protein
VPSGVTKLPNLLQNSLGVFTVEVGVLVGDVVCVVVTVVVVVVVETVVVVVDTLVVVLLTEVVVDVTEVVVDDTEVVVLVMLVVVVTDVVLLVMVEVVVVVKVVGVVVGDVVGVVISQPANEPSSKRDCTAALMTPTAASQSALVCLKCLDAIQMVSTGKKCWTCERNAVSHTLARLKQASRRGIQSHPRVQNSVQNRAPCTAIALPSCSVSSYPCTAEFKVYSSIIVCSNATPRLASVLSTNTLSSPHSTVGASPSASPREKQTSKIKLTSNAWWVQSVPSGVTKLPNLVHSNCGVLYVDVTEVVGDVVPVVVGDVVGVLVCVVVGVVVTVVVVVVVVETVVVVVDEMEVVVVVVYVVVVVCDA